MTAVNMPGSRIESRFDSSTDSRTQRHFLRSVVVPKTVLQVGEPVRVLAKLRRDAPDAGELATRIGGVSGLERFLSFATPGAHTVPVTIDHGDGRSDRTVIEFEVIAALGPHPHPILAIRQEPTNPFQLVFALKNAAEVHRDGNVYEWSIDGHGAYRVTRPFFVVDCERLLNPKDLVVPFDVHFTVAYPDGTKRTTSESFRVWNDYAWSKSRGILQPRLVYDFRARGVRTDLAALCVMVNDDDEEIVITGRQLEILHDDPDRVIVPGPIVAMDAVVRPRSLC